jgi:tetratricopeptide (TPR) repeat protein
MRQVARGVTALLCAVVTLHAAVSSTSRPPAGELRGLEGLVRAYDAILEARFDEVDAELRKACGPAPKEACDVLAATALWWRIQLDPGSHAFDPQFSTAVEQAIGSTEAWTEREPESAEAWFYLGAAYAVRVQWRVLRDQKLSAARDGKRILEALENSTELDPGLDDAYFGMGMYKYYAAVAPAAARMLRFLLFLPGGDKKVGLEQMVRARTRGKLLQGEADYQLSIIYLWYEQETARAIHLLEALQKQYPGNPHFPAQIAQVQDEYLHDTVASLGTWGTLLASARENRSNLPVLAETQSRLELARLLDELYLTDNAIEHLEAIIALKPGAPYSALPLAYLRLGQARDRLGARAQAVDAYRRAQAIAPSRDVHDIRETAAARLRRAPNAREAEAFRLSLEGWRLLEQNHLQAATTVLERSLSLDDDDPVARYRLGRVLQARKQDPAALVQFETTIREGRQCPAPILGTAYLEAARLHERAGRRDQAISYYRIASTLFGAAADTTSAATRALTRLRAR